MSVYARFINTEFKKGIIFLADNSLLWIFGYKFEGQQGSVGAFNGARVKVLGGMANEHAFSKNHPPRGNEGVGPAQDIDMQKLKLEFN